MRIHERLATNENRWSATSIDALSPDLWLYASFLYFRGYTRDQRAAIETSTIAVECEIASHHPVWVCPFPLI
jgi:hypothetical protein